MWVTFSVNGVHRMLVRSFKSTDRFSFDSYFVKHGTLKETMGNPVCLAWHTLCRARGGESSNRVTRLMTAGECRDSVRLRSFATVAVTDGANCRKPRAAIVRKVPDSFWNALAMEKPLAPIDVELARQQHATYVDILRGLVQEVIELPADNAFPDCPFVEDTVVVAGSKGLITRPGAPSRRGEEEVMKQSLLNLGVDISEVQPPGQIDGGDVLYAGGMFFVGKSRRTNDVGIQTLACTFPHIPVVAIEVPTRLHLKTVCSCIGPRALAVEENKEAQVIFASILAEAPFLKSVGISIPGAANTLLVGDTLLYPCSYGRSFENMYRQFARTVIPVDISEFHKADGGLTCLSVIIG